MTEPTSAGKRVLRLLKILSILLVGGVLGLVYMYFVLGFALVGTSLAAFFIPPLVVFLAAFAVTRWLGADAFLGVLAFYVPPGYFSLLLGITAFDWPYVLINAVLCVVTLLAVPLALRVRPKREAPPPATPPA